MKLKCDMCGKEESVEMMYVKSWDRVTNDEKQLWIAREKGLGFEGWILVGKRCRELMKIIAERNCMKVNDVKSNKN